VKNFDDVYSARGIDAVFVGPNDLMASMRDANGRPPSPEVFKQTLADILAGCKRNGVAAGIHTFSIEEAQSRIAEGWQFIAINSELRFMTETAKKVVDALGKSPGGEVAKY
jgi:4-hydroxy-2-oxoheptanedioate aldolase